jgi:hypothetical protein
MWIQKLTIAVNLNRKKLIMRQTISLLAAAVIVMAYAANASAQTETFTTSTPVSSSLTDWNNTLAFQQFNSSLGTLNSVELTLSSGFTTTLTVQNMNTSSHGGVKTELTVMVEDAGDHFNLDSPQLDILSSRFTYNLAADGHMTSGLLSANGSYTSEDYTLAAILSEFTGNGVIDLDASTFTTTDLSNTGGNTTSSQVTDASLTGTVTYDYTLATATPAPEETSTFGLLVLGLGSLPFLRRQRK